MKTSAASQLPTSAPFVVNAQSGRANQHPVTICLYGVFAGDFRALGERWEGGGRELRRVLFGEHDERFESLKSAVYRRLCEAAPKDPGAWVRVHAPGGAVWVDGAASQWFAAVAPGLGR